MPASCYAHPSVFALTVCVDCGRAICELCRFQVGYDSKCADCTLASAEARRTATAPSSVYSIVAGGAATLVFLGDFVLAAIDANDGLVGLLFFVSLGLAVTGIVLGMLARAAKKDDLLSWVALGVNGIVVASFLLLMCFGLMAPE